MRALHPSFVSSTSLQTPKNTERTSPLPATDAHPSRFSSLNFHQYYYHHQNHHHHYYYCYYIFQKVQVELPPCPRSEGRAVKEDGETMAVRRRAQDEKEKREEEEEEELLPSLNYVAPVNTHRTHTHTHTHIHTTTGTHQQSTPTSAQHKSTGQYKEFIASINTQKCAHTAERMCTDSANFAFGFCFHLKIGRRFFFNWFPQLVMLWKNDIIVSSGGEGRARDSFWSSFCFSSSFFSLHVRAVCLEKIRSDPFHKFFSRVPAFPASESSVYLRFLLFCFFYLYFCCLELQHSTHSTQTTKEWGRAGGGVGWGPESWELFTNIVPEGEKRGNNKKGIRDTEEHKEGKRGGREETAVSTIPSWVQLVSSQAEYWLPSTTSAEH